MPVQAIQPENWTRSEFLAQVVRLVSHDVLTVWALEHERAFQAYDVEVSQWAVGDVAVCRLDSEARFVASLTKADATAIKSCLRKRIVD